MIALLVTLASTVGGHLVHGKEKEAQKHYGERIVGGFLTMLFASLAAEAAPEVGALLAIAVASYAFLNYGLPAINGVYKEKASKETQSTLKLRTPGPESRPEPLREQIPGQTS